MSGNPSDVIVVNADLNHVLATFRNVAVCIWLRETKVNAVRAMSSTLANLGLRHERRIGLVQVIERDCKTLDSAARGALADMLSKGRDFIRCSALICDGDGFRSASVRMIASGLAQLSNPGYPHRVYSDATAAVRALATYLTDSQPESNEFVMSVSACIAELRAHPREARLHG